MNLLPQVSPEDLNEGDLQCWDLAVHEDSSQIKLHLETDVHLKTRETNLGCRQFFPLQNFNISQERGHMYRMFLVLTFALLMVGDHQSVKRRLGIWFRPDLWALVSFFHFMDSSKPLAFSL